jgi:hypothetical protein
VKHVPAKHFVEVAHLVNGEVISVKRLSPRVEWRSGIVAASVVMALSLAVGLVAAVALLGAGRVLYGPGYVALWLGVGLGVAAVAAQRARARARRYMIGAAIDDDAFAGEPMALVHRTGGAYHLAIAPGMTGRLEGGPSPVLLESLARTRQASVPLAPGARAELVVGQATFVLKAVPDDGQPAALPRGFARPYARRALVPLELAVVASVLLAVPSGARLAAADMKSAIPANATPWEVEKALRAEAQTQTSTLHQCFDVVPVECQRPGYVQVGVSLSRDGEIRDHWIARSTFGKECPVEQCMSDVVSTWFFEPLPESMKVVLPVQVLRTDKPLPLGQARKAENAARLQLARNGLTK